MLVWYVSQSIACKGISFLFYGSKEAPAKHHLRQNFQNSEAPATFVTGAYKKSVYFLYFFSRFKHITDANDKPSYACRVGHIAFNVRVRCGMSITSIYRGYRGAENHASFSYFGREPSQFLRPWRVGLVCYKQVSYKKMRIMHVYCAYKIVVI